MHLFNCDQFAIRINDSYAIYKQLIIGASYPNKPHQSINTSMNANYYKPVTTPKQKFQSYHKQFRCQIFEERKQQIRLRNIAINNLTNLVESMPSELKQVIEWSESITKYIGNVENGYEFPDQKIMDIFDLVKKYPCFQTIQLLYIVVHRISVSGIHQLFQYDIIGLLHNIITHPEKISISTLDAVHDKTKVQIDLVKYCIMAIAALCEKSENARNFIVTSHKSYMCIQKVYQTLNHHIRSAYVRVLYCFVTHPMEHDEQFIKICRKLIMLFTQSTYNIQQLIVLSKALTLIIKNKQKWAMDLIQSQNQYNILDKTLQYYDLCLQQPDKQHGELAHRLNMLMIHYIETTTNDYFCWQIFFTKWFCILETDSTLFQLARQDVYFLINNALFSYDIDGYGQKSDADQKISGFLRKCLDCLACNLQKETNTMVLMEMSSTLNQIFKFRLPRSVESHLLVSSLLAYILDLITDSCTRYGNASIYANHNNTLQYMLTSSLINLLNNASNSQFRERCSYLVQSRAQQLSNIMNFNPMDNDFCDKIEQLLNLVNFKTTTQL